MEEEKKYASVIVENRLSNALFDTIIAHREMLPEWWAHCHINDPSIKTLGDYNRLLTSREFWSQFERFDRVLIFQHDSKLLRMGIEVFLEYQFIGAPIKHIEGCMNGGLSLRDPKAMLATIHEYPYRGMDEDGYEDIYFVNWMRTGSFKLPDIETAMKFSVETIFYPNPLGVHAAEKWLTTEQLTELGL